MRRARSCGRFASSGDEAFRTHPLPCQRILRPQNDPSTRCVVYNEYVIEDRKEAERLAAALLDEITADNTERVRTSRDLTGDLAKDIDDARAVFEARVAEPLRPVFDEELLPWQGRAKDRAILHGGGESVDRTRMLLAIGAAIAFVVVVVWLVVR